MGAIRIQPRIAAEKAGRLVVRLLLVRVDVVVASPLDRVWDMGQLWTARVRRAVLRSAVALLVSHAGVGGAELLAFLQQVAEWLASHHVYVEVLADGISTAFQVTPFHLGLEVPGCRDHHLLVPIVILALAPMPASSI